MSNAAPALTPATIWQWGYNPIPLCATGKTKAPRPKEWLTTYFTPTDFQPGEGIGIRTGAQDDGSYLYVADFDHHPELGIDAPARYQMVLDGLGDLQEDVFRARSTGGHGRYIAFRCLRILPSTYLRDEQGHKVGDFLGEGRQVVAPSPDRWLHGSLKHIPLLEEDAQVDALLAALRYQVPVVMSSRREVPIDWAAVDQVDVAALLDKRNLPARMRSTTPGAQVLLNTAPTRDTSHARYTVAYELVRHEYTDTEAAAILKARCTYGCTKGTAWLEKDITRILTKCRTAQPDTQPLTEPRTKPPRQEPLLTVDAGGRPRKATLEAFLFYLGQNRTGPDRVVKTQGEIAAELKVSQRTVRRWERELRLDGRVERHLFADGQHSYLELFTPDKTSDVNGKGGTIGGDRFSCINAYGDSNTCDGGCGGDSVSGVETPTVVGLVEEALDAYQGVRQGPKRIGAVVRYVQANGRSDADPTWVSRLCGVMHRERQTAARDAAFVARVRRFSERQLTSRAASLSRRQAASHTAGKSGQAWVWGRMLWFIRQEDERREPLRRLLGRYQPGSLLEAGQ